MNLEEENQPTRFCNFCILISSSMYLVPIFIDFRRSEIEGNYETPHFSGEETKESSIPKTHLF